MRMLIRRASANSNIIDTSISELAEYEENHNTKMDTLDLWVTSLSPICLLFLSDIVCECVCVIIAWVLLQQYYGYYDFGEGTIMTPAVLLSIMLCIVNISSCTLIKFRGVRGMQAVLLSHSFVIAGTSMCIHIVGCCRYISQRSKSIREKKVLLLPPLQVANIKEYLN